MGGNKSTGSSQTPPAASISPISGVLAGLFGQDVRINKGGFQLLSPNAGSIEQRSRIDPLAGQAFGPGSFESVADLLTPQNMGAEFVPGLIQQLGEGAPGLISAAQEGAQTGFRTNVDDLVARSIRDARADISERFAGQTGSFSTDFLGALGEAQADIGARLNVQADEAAAGRRADLINLAAGLPGGIAGDLLNVGEQFTLDATEGGRAATLLQLLGGLQPTSAIPRGNVEKQRGKGGGVFSG